MRRHTCKNATVADRTPRALRAHGCGSPARDASLELVFVVGEPLRHLCANLLRLPSGPERGGARLSRSVRVSLLVAREGRGASIKQPPWLSGETARFDCAGSIVFAASELDAVDCGDERFPWVSGSGWFTSATVSPVWPLVSSGAAAGFQQQMTYGVYARNRKLQTPVAAHAVAISPQLSRRTTDASTNGSSDLSPRPAVRCSSLQLQLVVVAGVSAESSLLPGFRADF